MKWRGKSCRGGTDCRPSGQSEWPGMWQYLVHGSQPGGCNLLVICSLHAQLLLVQRARCLIVEQHATGSGVSTCTYIHVKVHRHIHNDNRPYNTTNRPTADTANVESKNTKKKLKWKLEQHSSWKIVTKNGLTFDGHTRTLVHDDVKSQF